MAVLFTDHLNAQTREICYQQSLKEVQEFKDTQWSTYDFYQNCLENIKYASPMIRIRK